MKLNSTRIAKARHLAQSYLRLKCKTSAQSLNRQVHKIGLEQRVCSRVFEICDVKKDFDVSDEFVQGILNEVTEANRKYTASRTNTPLKKSSPVDSAKLAEMIKKLKITGITFKPEGGLIIERLELRPVTEHV